METDDNRLWDTGDVVEVEGEMMEITSVSYQETDGERHTFTYAMRSEEELEMERQDAEEAEQKEAE